MQGTLAPTIAVPVPQNAVMEPFANATNVETSLVYLEAALRGNFEPLPYVFWECLNWLYTSYKYNLVLPSPQLMYPARPVRELSFPSSPPSRPPKTIAPDTLLLMKFFLLPTYCVGTTGRLPAKIHTVNGAIVHKDSGPFSPQFHVCLWWTDIGIDVALPLGSMDQSDAVAFCNALAKLLDQHKRQRLQISKMADEAARLQSDIRIALKGKDGLSVRLDDNLRQLAQTQNQVRAVCSFWLQPFAASRPQGLGHRQRHTSMLEKHRSEKLV